MSPPLDPLPLRPIRTADEHARALAEVERLWDAAAGSPEDDRLQVLVLLIENYERTLVPMAPPDPIDALLFRMDQAGLSTETLAALLGLPHARVCDIVARRRPLTLAVIRRLCTRLGMDSATLIGG